MNVLLIVMLVALNIGGFISLVFGLRQGQFGAALSNLLVLGLLNLLGFWVLRSMREDR
jgi:hypothetical protein